MSKEVYANGNEISCKKCKGKTSVAFPDPCWSPPPPPTGPLIIPYPNVAKPSSLKKGSKTVLIKGSMVALANKSYFSSSSGNEPATQAFQKGVLTRKLKGKAYYVNWSQNVKFEGKGVCRNFDLMTHNHGSYAGNTAAFSFLAKAESSSGEGPCAQDKKNIETACGLPKSKKAKSKARNWKKVHCKGILSKKTMKNATIPEILKEVGETNNSITDRDAYGDYQTKKSNKNACLQAKKCELISYNSANPKKKSLGTKGCCHGQTGHHLIGDKMINSKGCKSYSYGTAPTVCAEGVSHSGGSHGDLHTHFSQLTQDKFVKNKGQLLSRADAIDCAVQSHQMAFPNVGCQEKCIKAQLEAYYSKCPDAEYYPVTKEGGKLSSECQQELLKDITTVGNPLI